MPGEDVNERDKTRLCPTCRMPISVLATKCRYCGESVGRPRDESRKLTVSDLGGPSESQYAIGDEVLDAMDAFRKEEEHRLQSHRPDESKRGWFLRRKRPEHKRLRDDDLTGDLPKLDARNADLAAFSSSTRRSAMLAKPQEWKRRLVTIAAVVAGVIVLWFVGTFVKGQIDAYRARNAPRPPPPVVNQAVGIIARGGPPLEALRAAREAVVMSDTTENRKVLDQARELVKRDVDGLLNAVPWSVSNTDRASNMVSRALGIDPNSQLLKDLRAEVDDDLAAYKMTIDHIEYDLGRVTLRVQYADKPANLVLKKKDDVVRGRFRVQSVAQKYVIFEDLKRKSRGDLNRRFTLALDGGITVQ